MDRGQFFVAGINYKKTDAGTRGDYAVGPEQYAAILDKAAEAGLSEIFVLSTCNRTEIYGLAPDVQTLISLLCAHTTGDIHNFRQRAYIKQDREAIEHIFSVAAGLDSQILGDYEIVGQMKLAIRFAKERNMVGGYLERLFNTVLQSSKQIKNETALSGGTISVSFAAIQFIRAHITNTAGLHIAVLGTGKIGRNTCKNLVDYLDTRNITLINRTRSKAEELAASLQIAVADWVDIPAVVAQADVVIVATNAEKPVITTQLLRDANPKILIDLSIPNNIDPAVAQIPGMQLANVDDLSRINDQTLQKRQAEIPKAKTIIHTHMIEFGAWSNQRKYVPVLKAVKQKLHDLHHCDLFLNSHKQEEMEIDTAAIQKVVNTVAVKLRSHHQPGCHYIEAINDFMKSTIY
ncbi:MAG: glutamyl-tRNA reductase [Chitinophagaceae bacterium]|nr:glutamyl-tRNA reductase [Chitinophagaceae bacterium]